jgi:hypothetical protein
VGGTLPASLLQSLLQVQQSYVLSDPRLPDCPIVHASAQFLGMTGYRREEVVGRNCRFLQVRRVRVRVLGACGARALRAWWRAHAARTRRQHAGCAWPGGGNAP